MASLKKENGVLESVTGGVSVGMKTTENDAVIGY
jgi:hypothetical protein